MIRGEDGVNIIYYCYGSAHSSIVCAHLHLGHLPKEPASMEEIMALPDFDRTQKDDLGHFFFKGKDERNHAVYTAALGSHPDMLVTFLLSLARIKGVDPQAFCFVDALSCLGYLGKMGGALSRRYGLVTMGRRLAAWGIRQSYPRFVRLVEQTKLEIRQRERKHCLSAQFSL